MLVLVDSSCRKVDGDHLPLNGETDDAKHVLCAGLADHVFTVTFHSLLGYEKLTGNLLAGIALVNELEDFPLSFGKAGNECRE